MPTLTIIRGLPGAGKTTLAKTLGQPVFEADDFFVTRDGKYLFVAALLPEAHSDCLRRIRECLASGESCVVANTFSRKWEMSLYRKAAEDNRANVEVIDLFDAGLTDAELSKRCRHGVGVESVARMRARWEP